MNSNNDTINRSAELIDAENYEMLPSELRGEIEELADKISELELQSQDEACFYLFEQVAKRIDANKMQFPASCILIAEIKNKLVNRERNSLYRVRRAKDESTN